MSVTPRWFPRDAAQIPSCLSPDETVLRFILIVPLFLSNKNPQQCSLPLVVKPSATINLSHGQGTKPAYRQCNIEENIEEDGKEMGPDTICWKRIAYDYNKTNNNIFFVHFTSCFALSEQNSYRLFHTLICTRPWGQISGSKVDHRREWALLTVPTNMTKSIVRVMGNQDMCLCCTWYCSNLYGPFPRGSLTFYYGDMSH